MDDRIKKKLVLTKFDFLKILKIQEIYYKMFTNEKEDWREAQKLEYSIVACELQKKLVNCYGVH